MRRIPIANIPNQSFTVRLDDDRYDITIKETRGCMSVNMSRNDAILFTGLRAVAGTPLIPYIYQEEGNFIITTMDEELPDYTQFGITQFLVYLTVAEVEILNAGA